MKLPVLTTLQGYKKKNLPKDLLSGVVIAAVSIPISMGYAQIAGLPAVYGLYGSVLPVLLFALFSTSPQFIFGVTPPRRPWWARCSRRSASRSGRARLSPSSRC